MTMLPISSQASPLSRKIAVGVTPAHLLVAGIMLLSGVLHFTNLSVIGDANTYYTAAVKSMLQSWSNFFFVAAEPGGSVTVDKPPLGLWIEAAFAFALGVQGWVVSLPNLLAGIFSVPLLYHLVRKYLGAGAGLTAALVLTVTPIAVATDRNNTMDGMLVFTLLLAAWAFIAATESGRLRWLFAGALLLGLGFNIKMLQAFLPLPAFYALYLLGAKAGWGKKLFNCALSVIVLLAVSLSWAVIVDLTPAGQRPYIGSSQDNTVMELIVGHNGLARLVTPRAGGNAPPQGNAPMAPAPDAGPGGQPASGPPVNSGGQVPPPQALMACQGQKQEAACSFTLPDGRFIQGNCIVPPGMNQLTCTPRSFMPPSAQPSAPASGGQPDSPRPGFDPPPGALGDGSRVSPNSNADGPQSPGGVPFSHETGSPGLARFFLPPLSRQMSWLLPFALAGVLMTVFAARPRLPLPAEHKAFVLWGGWLLTCLIFFSTVAGIFHAYYTIMLAPPLGAAVGAGMMLFWRWQAQRPLVNAGLIFIAAVTLAFQVFTAAQYGVQSTVVWVPGILLLIGAGLAFVNFLPGLSEAKVRPAAYLVVLTALVFLPWLWTGMTVLDRSPDVNLPTAFNGRRAPQAQPQPAPLPTGSNRVDEALVAFLQANTQKVEYLVAVPNAHIGAPLVLATGRPVLYMGGFSGADPVIDTAGLAAMVAEGRLRYVLFGDSPEKQDIAHWLASSCTPVPEFSRSQPSAVQSPAPNQPTVLYRCGP